MPKRPMHVDQHTLTTGMVRRLVDEQFPQWRGLPIERVRGAGTVNAIFRIGDDYAARLPLRGTDVDKPRRDLAAEAAAAREFAAATRFPAPCPIAVGEPGAGYPLPWSIHTWLPGTVATDEDPGASSAFASDLATLIRELRAADTCGRTFSGRRRGGHLQEHDRWMAECFTRSEQLLDVPRLRGMWADFRMLPRGPAPDVMSHGDLMPANLLVDRGRLAGVLDVGGFAPADPALDLVAAWHLLEAGPRDVLRRELGCGDLEWARGQAWAFAQAMGLVWYYETSNPGMAQQGRRTLGRLLADGVV